MKLTRKLLGLGVALAVSGAAQSATVDQTLFAGFQQLSDNSAEVLLNPDGSIDATGIINMGDRLRSIFTIETVEKAGNPTRGLGAGSGNNELSGIADITVTNILNPAAGIFIYSFSATAGLAAEFGLAGTSAAIVLFEDPAAEYERTTGATCTSAAINGDCEDNVNDGAVYAAFGFGGGNGAWTAQAVTNDINVIGAVPAPGNGGTFNVGLVNIAGGSHTATFGNVACGVGGTVQICGSGSLLGIGGVTTPYDIFDNIDFTINNAVPAPATLALFGAGLLGFSATRRRSSK